MSRLVEHIGFFELVFGDSPKTLTEAPTAAIGKSRLTISWHMDGSDDVVVQHLYPYAEGGPVTHVEPGQRFWDGHETTGGWFQVTGDIASPLVEFGVAEDVFSPITKSAVTEAAPATDKGVADKAAADTAPAKGKVATDKVATDKGVADKAPGAKADAGSGSLEPAAPARSGSSFPTGVAIAALLAAAAIMGVTAWMRQRRPMPR